MTWAIGIIIYILLPLIGLGALSLWIHGRPMRRRAARRRMIERYTRLEWR